MDLVSWYLGPSIEEILRHSKLGREIKERM